jgi:hypothetical protein
VRPAHSSRRLDRSARCGLGLVLILLSAGSAWAQAIGPVSRVGLVSGIDLIGPSTPTPSAEEQNLQGTRETAAQERYVDAVSLDYNALLLDKVSSIAAGEPLYFPTGATPGSPGYASGQAGRVVDAFSDPALAARRDLGRYGRSVPEIPIAGGIVLTRPADATPLPASECTPLLCNVIYREKVGPAIANEFVVTCKDQSWVFSPPVPPEEVGLIWNAVFRTERHGLYVSGEGTGTILFEGQIADTTVGRALWEADLLFGQLVFGEGDRSGELLRSPVASYPNALAMELDALRSPGSNNYNWLVSVYRNFRRFTPAVTIHRRTIVTLEDGGTDANGRTRLVPYLTIRTDGTGTYVDWYGNEYFDAGCQMCWPYDGPLNDIAANFGAYAAAYPVFKRLQDIAVTAAFLNMIRMAPPDSCDQPKWDFRLESKSTATLFDLNCRARRKEVRTAREFRQPAGYHAGSSLAEFDLAQAALWRSIASDASLEPAKRITMLTAASWNLLRHDERDGAAGAHDEAAGIVAFLPDEVAAGVALPSLPTCVRHLPPLVIV